MQVQFRTFRATDTGALVELVERAMPADPVSIERFTEYVLLEPSFSPAGLIVAADRTSGHPVGFVYAVRPRGVGPLAGTDGGWITIGAVDPRARRRGVGMGLVTRALSFLRETGARWVEYSGYPPAYFLPGLDADTYPDGLRLLKRAGFRTVSRPVAMDARLATYRLPDAVAALRQARAADGYSVHAAGYGDVPAVVAFAATEFAPDWGEAVRASVIRSGRPDRVVIARDPDGAVVGFATYGAYRGPIERFGPFGVAAAQRGRGLGAILLHTALTRMRGEGAHGAWFLWTGADSPAGRLYASAGFAVTRTFHVMRADLVRSEDD